MLLDADTGERMPYFAELDATVSSDANAVLFVRPARNLREGHRHIVALRNLATRAAPRSPQATSSAPTATSCISNVPEVEARREHFERVFAELEDAGVARDDLYLAWDFTVASERNLSERMLHIRDDAFARLGDAAPAFTVTSVEENVERRAARDGSTGTFEVPLYLTGAGAPGTRFTTAATALPARQRHLHRRLHLHRPASGGRRCERRAVPARPSSTATACSAASDEVSAGNVRSMANEHNFVFCATKWIGMSEEDIAQRRRRSSATSRRFPTLADRLQQGVLNTLFLGRLMIHPDGPGVARGVPGRRRARHRPSELFYDGNSQGGIMGGAATAVSTDWTRAVLGVPGDELQHPAAPQRRLGHLPTDLRPGLSGRARARARLAADPDAVGPRRGERLRAAT